VISHASDLQGNPGSPYPDASGAALRLAYPETSCSSLAGRFVVHELAVDPDGTVRSFAADVEQSCNGMRPAFAAIRFNSAFPDSRPFAGHYPVFLLDVEAKPGPGTSPPAAAGTVVVTGASRAGQQPRCRGFVDRGTTLTLTAVASPGYAFQRWVGTAGKCNGLNQPTLPMSADEDILCSARFRRAAPAGIGDVDGKGRLDLLWQHDTTGALIGWSMERLSMLDSFVLSSGLGDTRWTAVGAGDFNQDGGLDLLWQHESDGRLVVWILNGGTYAGAIPLSSVGDVNWRVVAVNDFDGDGGADLLWHHRSTGALVLWLMNGTVVRSSAPVGESPVSDTGWQVAAAADFNDDGYLDVLWRHRVTGGLAVWFLDAQLRTIAPAMADAGSGRRPPVAPRRCHRCQ
jgi:hypothetical protein